MRPLGPKWTRIPVSEYERQAAKYRGLCHIEGLHFEKKLALTFDDGPSNHSETLLDILGGLGVKATFFWLGRTLKDFSVLARRVLAEGHTLGNHSYDHTNFTKISTEEVLRDQIIRTQQIYRETLGFEPALVRPPYGEITDVQIEALNGMGMDIVFWSVCSNDWNSGNNDAEKIIKRVVNNVHEESIVLMHDDGPNCRNTERSVRSIVDMCRNRGYEFVTVHDLIGAEESL